MEYDLIVIGGGPAGYVGAIRAAQLGKKVACVERDRVGGTCLNWGCIPTKALLKSAEVYESISKKGAEFGISAENASFNWPDVIGRSRKVSERLAGGVDFLFKKHKIDSIKGEATVLDSGKVSVTSPEGEETVLEGAKVLIATGCVAKSIPGITPNGRNIITSKEAMVLPERPESMLVIGSGAIGIEFASIYNTFGTQVTVLEALPRILPNEDDDSSQALERAFKKQGIKCLKGVSVESVNETADGNIAAVITNNKGEKEELTANVCLVAIGVKPVVPPSAAFELTPRGFIAVNDRYETSIPGVYAAGDIIGGVLLAHTASFEAVQAVEGMFIEGYQPKKVGFFPSCTYCHPQVASSGRTERDLKDEGVEYKVGKFPMMAIGRAVAGGETDGFVKLLFGVPHGELLGAHIVSENATELISGMGIALQAELTDEDFHSTIFAHPTLSEAIHEATLAADGQQIHA